jgi:UDP-N-acetylglucosamine kinase
MLTGNELKLQAQSLQWLRANTKKLKSELCDLQTFKPEHHPVSIFMAGTPGAGKTEFSKTLIEAFDKPIIRMTPTKSER